MDLGFVYYTHHLSFTVTLSHRFPIPSDSIADTTYGTQPYGPCSPAQHAYKDYLAHDQNSRTILATRTLFAVVYPTLLHPPTLVARCVRPFLSAPCFA